MVTSTSRFSKNRLRLKFIASLIVVSVTPVFLHSLFTLTSLQNLLMLAFVFLVDIVLGIILLSPVEKLYKNFEKFLNAIQVERKKLSVVISGISDVVIAVDNNRHIIMFNEAAEKMLGVSKKDILGKNIKEVIRVFSNEVEIPSSDYCPTTHVRGYKGTVHNKQNVTIIDSKNREHFANIYTSRIDKDHSMNVCCMIIIHDTTYEMATQKTKSEFVSIAAHQLRTPLSAVKWSLSSLIQQDEEKLTSKQKKAISMAYTSNERMIAIINDLLQASRLNDKKFKYSNEYVDIQDVINSAIAGLERLVTQTGIKITITRPQTKIPKVKLDSESLGVVVKNLLNNAIQYSPKKGEIEISVKKTDSEVRVSIKDSGIGIPDKDKSRVFTRFFRSPNAVKLKTDGSGLGLYVVKSIVNAHGGDIWFESQEGKGSTFTFSLPI